MLFQIFILLIISTSIGIKPEKSNAQNFREIILFTYSDEDSTLKKQIDILKSDPKGLAERDLKIFVKIWGKDKLASHQKFKIPKNQFAFVLIGKDGGEKYRSLNVVTQQKLYSIIDAMPMRIYEMKKSDN